MTDPSTDLRDRIAAAIARSDDGLYDSPEDIYRHNADAVLGVLGDLHAEHTRGADLVPLMEDVCAKSHEVNASVLHREGFCLACAEVYTGLHLMAAALDANDAYRPQGPTMSDLPTPEPDSDEATTWRDPYAAVTDEAHEAAWEEAERLADLLERDGWVCGHPDRGAVEHVLRAAILAGLIATEEPRP